MCGYSQSENLMRLQRCLKGKALETVGSNLLLPTSVPKIMETLETLFGSPERLVQSLLNKVRSVPTPKADKLETLVNFGLVVQNLVGHLIAANQQAHLTNPTLLQELVDKLPPNLRLDWALYKKNVRPVDLGTFSEYMSVIASAASDVAHFSDFDGARTGGSEKQRKEKTFVNAHVSTEPRRFEQQGKKAENQEKPCYICQSLKHRIKDCHKFRSLNFSDRLKAVELHQLCSICLVPHGRWSCKSTRTCGVGDCTKKHHPSLHPSQQIASKPSSNESTGARPKPDAVVNVHRRIKSATIFRIIPVVLYGREAQVSTFPFLDEGSSSTLIEKEVADQLNLGGELQPLCLTWTAKVSRHEKDSRMVSLKISGTENSKSFSLTGVITVRRLDLPVQSLKYGELSQHFPYLAGIPVTSYQKAVPKILIGLDNIKLSLPLKTREGWPNGPVAAKTRLGWTVFGSIDGSHGNSTLPLLHICKSAEDSKLHDLVKGYFAAENLAVSGTFGPEAEEDRRAKEILRRTTVKGADGHYETGLLWRNDVVELPSSYGMAERRLICLERKLRKYPELQANLEKQISEYQSKGYAHKATSQEMQESDPSRTWYLPLGVVTNPRKPGKIRIIWDAAAKSNGVSLNDMLLKGPDLLSSLPAILCRFRQRHVAIAGDIREMYHQLKIRKEDRQVQRFLYRSDPAKEPEVFVMDVAIFGSTCSPCSANFVKNLNAMEWKDKYPEAATAVAENHYVDDYLDSRDTAEDMAKLASEVPTVQTAAGFELRNWRSNSMKVLQVLEEKAAETPKDFSVDKESNVERVLGMAWLPDEDVFVYSVKLPNEFERSASTKIVTTKRSILRFVMSIFDPLGLIPNLLIHGKVIIQDLWRAQVGWDDTIPIDILEQWERWIVQLSKLNQVRIPRCYFPDYDRDALHALELHVFVDASELAFACIAYVRIIDQGQTRCSLVASKAKVAPLKPLSIPRLELQAAVIGSRLVKSIAEYHTLPITRRFLWSDSKTVLSWIKSDARKYRQYVAVRIGEILEETQTEEWRWVPTKLNVADEATKLGKGPTLQPGGRWFTGPDFLYKSENEWPQERVTLNTEEELRALHVHRVQLMQPFLECERFSKWERMLRATTYVCWFVDRCGKFCKQEAKPAGCTLQQEHLVRAERMLWRLVQAQEFAEEIVVLMKNKASDSERLKLETSSCIRHLSPFLDEFGVIRMEDRPESSEALGSTFHLLSSKSCPLGSTTDHGTNFVGASRELASQLVATNRELAEIFTDTNTRWFFIPPSSPHMGGAWERMVRAVKTAMESVGSCRAPSEEVFQTILCEAESMVNSRPLTYVPLETSDQEALTPNHFIHLSSNGVKQPDKIPATESEALRNGWNLCRYILDKFWARWIREYLPVLTRRTKWHEEVRPIREGDMVFIIGESIRNRWPRGKVVQVIPGRDGRIRQVDVQTTTGVLRRPVAKLALIDVLPASNPAGLAQHYVEGNVAGGVTNIDAASENSHRDGKQV
ncbi:uncharacterized protein LOC134205975 [Armigeres subalbatus]|uniref:uncharacterized protein LOC134205975 n=1 Tax=Armigeres subalbatus TaxID=124917 RepID=UPI002ED3A222